MRGFYLCNYGSAGGNIVLTGRRVVVDKAANVALEHPAIVKTLAGYGILRDKIPPSPIHTLKTVETIRPIRAPFFLFKVEK